MKKILTLIISMLILFSGCNKEEAKPEKRPLDPFKVMITCGDEVISHHTGLNTWNMTLYDRRESFEYIMENKSASNLPYIELGSVINIELIDGRNPDIVAVTYDEILNEDGSQKYSMSPAKGTLEFTDMKASFTLEVNPASILSSNSADYEKGATIRGIKIVCRWDYADGFYDELEYAFIFRTDAGTEHTEG